MTNCEKQLHGWDFKFEISEIESGMVSPISIFLVFIKNRTKLLHSPFNKTTEDEETPATVAADNIWSKLAFFNLKKSKNVDSISGVFSHFQSDPFYFSSASSNHDDRDERTSRLSPTTSTATAEKLFIVVSQHRALLDIWDGNYKNYNLDIWQSIADQLDWVGGR